MGQLILNYGNTEGAEESFNSLEFLGIFLKAHYSIEEVRDLIKKDSL